MAIHVTSEIGQLKRVLLKRPGRELEHLSPETMETLLFDDIPYLHRAQAEHVQPVAQPERRALHGDALVGDLLHKTVRRQPPEGLPDRGTADLILVGDGHLLEPLAGTEHAGANVLLQKLIYLLLDGHDLLHLAVPFQAFLPF